MDKVNVGRRKEKLLRPRLPEFNPIIAVTGEKPSNANSFRIDMIKSKFLLFFYPPNIIQVHRSILSLKLTHRFPAFLGALHSPFIQSTLVPAITQNQQHDTMPPSMSHLPITHGGDTLCI